MNARSEPTSGLSGLFFVLCSATSLGAITPFARLAYDGGANPTTLLAIRFTSTVVLLFLILKLTRGVLRLPRASIKPVLISGFAWLIGSFAYLSSILYIPVSLAVLCFYTFPLVILAYSLIRRESKFSFRLSAIYLGAFTGLVMAIGPVLDEINYVGLFLALIGSLGVAGNMIFGALAVRHCNPIAASLYTSLLQAVGTLIVLFGLGNIALPVTDSGWEGLTFATLFYALGITLMFVALVRISAVKAAITYNIEPLISILLAILLLGERLTALQWVGASTVITAIIVAALFRSNPPPSHKE
ncbi:MAG: DMT family transporter [Arenicellales bacterium]|jgi:drug/metabolite transporter (DMT)-like permease|nr:DMT family transporter [Arenicellales bacterium]MDP7156344.1 DMT family transporter [Arenicellales bacterium]MDP7282878.1 DMT family transporter [Arenicellales bacterium]MDP7481501.1 DMT family transporter [Arenicellales bacterium]HJL66098.1 DMT family transporter [Arenicellales bacterium]